MEVMIEQLKEYYGQLEELRAKRKDLNKMVSEACQNNHEFCRLTDEAKELGQKRKLIKDGIIDELQIRGDLQDSKTEIAGLKELIADVTLNLIKANKIGPHEEINVGDFVIQPKFNLTYTKQLSLNL